VAVGNVEHAFVLAQERFEQWDVDVGAALRKLRQVPVSMNCWQGDDVGGFESAEGLTGGGIMATGN